MKNRTLFALALMMGLLLFPLGCGGNDLTDMDQPPDMDESLVLQPPELCSENPSTAIATFEDANLEARVRSALSVSPQQDLTCGLVSGLTELHATSTGPNVISLVGLQNLTSLTTLDLEGSFTGAGIIDISALSALTSLADLRLDGNSITDISALSALTSLATLHLDNNSITDISALSGLTSLATLILSFNSITDISALSGLTSLALLHLSFNSITDLGPLSGLTSLPGQVPSCV